MGLTYFHHIEYTKHTNICVVYIISSLVDTCAFNDMDIKLVLPNSCVVHSSTAHEKCDSALYHYLLLHSVTTLKKVV